MARAIWSHNRNDLEESSYIYVNNIQVGEVAHTIRLTSLEAEQVRYYPRIATICKPIEVVTLCCPGYNK